MCQSKDRKWVWKGSGSGCVRKHCVSEEFVRIIHVAKTEDSLPVGGYESVERIDSPGETSGGCSRK